MISNRNIAELRALDVAHHLPPQADYAEIAARGGSRIVTHGEGVFITDGDGNRILDGMAGLWCVQVGYGRKELAEAAYTQMVELPYYNGFFKTATAPTIELAAEVASLTNGLLPHVFFSSSGSEAIDTALRMVRRYWDVRGEPNRDQIIARVNAYHGTSIASMSVGGMARMHAQGPVLPGFHHVRQPYAFNEGFGEDPDQFAQRCAQAIEDKILALGAERVAAIFAEPVQGAGGVIIPPDGYWPKVAAIARKYGVLLVVDEVICGFGRLGRWFGHQHYGVEPDIITMAKGITSGYLPLSATAVSARIATALRDGGDFAHGYTYSGHPVASAVALANIALLKQERLVERVGEDSGPYLAEALGRLRDHPLVGEVRTIGLLGAIEIVATPGTNRRFTGVEGVAGPIVRDYAIDCGLMVRAVRDTIVTCPPLTISHDEIDMIAERLRRALDSAELTLRAL
jgi:putrescine---pyruvate transaminase